MGEVRPNAAGDPRQKRGNAHAHGSCMHWLVDGSGTRAALRGRRPDGSVSARWQDATLQGPWALVLEAGCMVLTLSTCTHPYIAPFQSSALVVLLKRSRLPVYMIWTSIHFPTTTTTTTTTTTFTPSLLVGKADADI